jgi:hypothetical protein
VRTWSLVPQDLAGAVEVAKEEARKLEEGIPVEKEEPMKTETKSGMTAEEEAELAELMDDEDD